MTSRPDASHDTERTRLSQSRSSSVASLNVFSDNHAIPSPTLSFDGAFLADTRPHHSEPLSPSSPQTRNSASLAQYPSLPARQSEAGSTTKRRLMIDDVPTSSNATNLERSPSNASRLSIPRAPSPYNGPTAPSHPYAMYPQVTRASSIASMSTIRPHSETPFVMPRSGPEHPYSLYPQNVSVEEEDEDITANGIPIGFPHNASFQRGGPSNSEVGDIVGSDGHIEQLPPYTRYADNTVAKGNMNHLNTPSMVDLTRTRSSTAPSSGLVASSIHTNESAPLNPQQPADGENVLPPPAKKSLKQIGQRRVCGALPLWILLLVVLCIVVAGTVGGVVGGVIGDRQGAERAYAMGATTTVWLDAVPTTTAPGTSPLPEGIFEIPLNQTNEIPNCVQDPRLVPAWGCMDIAYIGVNISQAADDGPIQAIFEDFSVNTANFKYGPQPPDFNGTAFDLKPYHDKDDYQYGVAMFFSVLFDKLSILPEDVIDGDDFPEPIERRALDRRAARYDGKPLRPSDRPWFCFWNSTVNEFFIYLDESAPTNATNSRDAYPGAAVTTAASLPPLLGPTNVAAQQLTVPTGTTAAQADATWTTFQAYNPTPPMTTSISRTGQSKRSYISANPNVSNYPKLVKVVEKRMPSNNIQPYCQKMQVLDSWEIVPIPTVPTVCVTELQWATESNTAPAAAYTQNNKIRLARAPSRQKREDSVQAQIDFESNCICEWISY